MEVELNTEGMSEESVMNKLNNLGFDITGLISSEPVGKKDARGKSTLRIYRQI
jgi:hypothetical protein